MARFFLCFVSVLFFFSCSAAPQKEMKASEIIRLLQKGKNVQIINKIIWDDLNFTVSKDLKIAALNRLQNDIEGSVFFSNCVFMGNVTSNGQKESLLVCTRFKSNLIFHECDFRGEVDFSGACVYGIVNFNKSVFRENAQFDQLVIWSKNNYFSEVKAEKKFSMVYTSVKGNLYFLNAGFDGGVSFQEISVDGKLSFNNSIFKEDAGFDLMSINGAAFFNYTTFEKGANFSMSRFLSTTDFINTKFEGKGDFKKAFFLNTVRFKGVDTVNSLILTDAFFGNKVIEYQIE